MNILYMSFSLRKSIDYPLSDQEIRQYLLKDGPVCIIDYDQLGKVRDIEQLFYPQGYFILLYKNTESPVGHWIAVIDHGQNIEFFDPRGMCPDRQLYHLGQRHPKIVELLLQIGKPVIYNNVAMQDELANTCGRWCILRCNTRDVPLRDFQKMMCSSKIYTPDQMVAMLVRVYRQD